MLVPVPPTDFTTSRWLQVLCPALKCTVISCLNTDQTRHYGSTAVADVVGESHRYPGFGPAVYADPHVQGNKYPALWRIAPRWPPSIVQVGEQHSLGTS